MINNWEIRKLGSGEIELAQELILLFGNEDKNRDLPPVEYLAQMLARKDFHVVVAVENEKLIGGLSAYEMKMFKRPTTEMFLYEIEVAQAHRQKGIGKALIEFLKQICLEKGIVEMFVGTSKDNLAAGKLYKATGGKADEDSLWFNYLF
jgi:aminoglycoside 3-N-acetyltransferase I